MVDAPPTTPRSDVPVRTRWTISELAQEFGVTARALRHYEDEGLLAPHREGAARIYGRRERARLSLILRGKRAGFSLDIIREIIDLHDRADGGAEQRRVAALRCRERIAELEEQRAGIDGQIARLRRFADEHERR
ncbi:MAG: MerR family DNA-binding transcriptional regulator [Proteobacteria bacterium]|nr:MerR family DNA-binding transcriptional regulator [Pseudomonadota bacterium]